MEAQEHHDGPDPTRVVTLDDLSRELNLLRARAARGTRSARVSLDHLARKVGEPKSSIHAYVAGIRLAPAQVLDRMVIALGASSAEQREWAEAWYRVAASRQPARRDSVPALGGVAVPHQLPAAVDTFVGRAEQLRQLDELMGRSPAGTVVAICGTAGVGKTALALQWAQSRGARFADGQLHVDLGGFGPDQPLHPGKALARLLRALGMPNEQIAREIDERAAQLRSLLFGRRTLIVLDNARDTEQVRPLLPGPPSCTLVTSRDSLPGLVARLGAHRLDLDALQLPEAVELLRALLGVPWATEHGDVSADLVALAEKCGRLPLALRIAADLASSRPGFGLRDLVDDLARGDRDLDLLEAGDDPRTGLRAVFSWSYRALPVAAARAFRFIGAHTEGELRAEAFAALLDLTTSDARRLLDSLSQAHLVREIRPGWYATSALLRAYAREQALASDPQAELAAAAARLREHRLRTMPQPIVVPRPTAGAEHDDLDAGAEHDPTGVPSWTRAVTTLVPEPASGVRLNGREAAPR